MMNIRVVFHKSGKGEDKLRLYNILLFMFENKSVIRSNFAVAASTTTSTVGKTQYSTFISNLQTQQKNMLKKAINILKSSFFQCKQIPLSFFASDTPVSGPTVCTPHNFILLRWYGKLSNGLIFLKWFFSSFEHLEKRLVISLIA